VNTEKRTYEAIMPDGPLLDVALLRKRSGALFLCARWHKYASNTEVEVPTNPTPQADCSLITNVVFASAALHPLRARMCPRDPNVSRPNPNAGLSLNHHGRVPVPIQPDPRHPKHAPKSNRPPRRPRLLP